MQYWTTGCYSMANDFRLQPQKTVDFDKKDIIIGVINKICYNYYHVLPDLSTARCG